MNEGDEIFYLEPYQLGDIEGHTQHRGVVTKATRQYIYVEWDDPLVARRLPERLSAKDEKVVKPRRIEE